MKEEKWGVGLSGRKKLRVKSRVVDFFKRRDAEDKESEVAIWKKSCDSFIETFNQKTKNLKKELKAKLIPNETKKILSKKEITKLNQYYFDKCNFKDL